MAVVCVKDTHHYMATFRTRCPTRVFHRYRRVHATLFHMKEQTQARARARTHTQTQLKKSDQKVYASMLSGFERLWQGMTVIVQNGIAKL